MPNIKDKAYSTLLSYISLLKKDFNCSDIKENQYSFECTVLGSKEKIKLLVYFGKSGVKTVIQGNKESRVYLEVNSLINGEEFFDKDIKIIPEPDIYLGTDESGKGDYFGPLVIAGVIVTNETSSQLKKLGIKDSKLLTDTVINQLIPDLMKIIKDDFNIITITPSTYNVLHERMGNVNRLLGWAHAKIIENLLQKKEVPAAISDKFGDESYISRNLGDKGKSIKLYQITKAEKYTAVAAASILARFSFNKWFTEMKNNGIDLPKGASSIVDRKVKEIKNKFDIDYLNKIAKLHFKTTNK